MATQKRTTGEWPVDLNGIPKFLRREYNRTTAYYSRERIADVEDFHRRNYLSLRILHKDDRTCTIILQLKGREEKIEIDVNNAPDD